MSRRRGIGCCAVVFVVVIMIILMMIVLVPRSYLKMNERD